MNDFQAATLQEWRQIEEIVAKLINWSMLENKFHNLKSPINIGDLARKGNIPRVISHYRARHSPRSFTLQLE